jgi:hypothetical protein
MDQLNCSMSQLNLFSAFEDFGTILQGLESRLSPSHQNVNLDNDESVSKRFQVGIRPNINPLNNPIPSYRLLKRPWKERPQINVNR